MNRSLLQSLGISLVLILGTLDSTLAYAQAGAGYVIERIEVRGNEKTQPEVILRSLELKEGDVLTPEGIRKSREALYRTLLFRTVHVASRPGSESGTAVVMVYVREKRFGDVGVSLEYTELDGFGIAADAYHVNLGGQGRLIGGEYGLGERFRYWGLSYSHPYLSSSGLSLHIRVRGSLADRDLYRAKNPDARGSYDLERIGATFGLGQQLGVGHRVILSYTFEEVDVNNPVPPSSPAGGTPFADEVVASAGTDPTAYVSIDVHNRPDAEPWGSRPGTILGARGDFSGSFLGSTGDYIRFRAEAYRHIETVPGHILSLGGKAGLIVGEPPFYERFYLESENQLRGFERREIGPDGGERLLMGEALYSLSISGLGRVYAFGEGTGIWRTTNGQTLSDQGVTVGIGILLFNRVDISFGLGTGVLIVKSHRFGGINVGL